jgi:hypothetical protein
MQKNREIIKRELISEIDTGLDFTKKKISHLYKGIFSVFNPLLEKLFEWFALDRARDAGIKRIDFFLDIASGCDSKNLEKIVEKYFEEYLRHSESYARLNLKHGKFPEFKANQKEEFRMRVEILSKLLAADGDTYDELVKDAFPKRSDLDKLLNREYGIVERQMKLIETSHGLMKIPRMMRSEVFIVTRSAYEFQKKKMCERCDSIYSRQS